MYLLNCCIKNRIALQLCVRDMNRFRDVTKINLVTSFCCARSLLHMYIDTVHLDVYYHMADLYVFEPVLI